MTNNDTDAGMVGQNSGSVTNCYYLTGSCGRGLVANDDDERAVAEISEKSSQDMQSDSFVNLLNQDVESSFEETTGVENNYIKDDGTNNGYPIINKIDIEDQILNQM